ncbi:hypothetical protein FE392_19725, partial [Xenorhabdus sp. 12]
QYISPDPIGLVGGANPYGYVHNPTGWIDPFGLAGKDCHLLALSDSERKTIDGLLEKISAGKTHNRIRHGHFENVKDIENITWIRLISAISE